MPGCQPETSRSCLEVNLKLTKTYRALANVFETIITDRKTSKKDLVKIQFLLEKLLDAVTKRLNRIE